MGFISENKLYLIATKFYGEKYITEIHVSNLDRSESKIMASFDAGYSLSFAVADKKLYLPIDIQQFKELEDGTIEPSSQNICRLVSIDLETGRVEDEIKEKVDFHNTLQILAADQEKVYLSYTFHERAFDGTNFDETGFHKEYLVYNIETEELSSILNDFEDDESISTMIVSSSEILAVVVRNVGPGASASTDIRRIDLTDESTVTVVECDGYPYELGDSLFYRVKGSAGFFEVKLEDSDVISHENMVVEDIYPLAEAGDYVYISVQKPNMSSAHGFIKKLDFLNGNLDTMIDAH